MKYILPILFLLPLCLRAQLNDIVERKLTKTERQLAYPQLREADVLWQKRTWRVIDTREKMNQTFMYPAAPFFEILREEIRSGAITTYTDDTFQEPYAGAEVLALLSSIDTVPVFNLVTQLPEYEVVENELFYEDIKRFRISEIWYFDSQTSQMRVRILGIAPLKEEYDENGNFLFERPLFWVHYPSARTQLSRHEIFVDGNDTARTTWDDIFEQRRFSSYIYRESNIRNDRLSDRYAGRERLLAGERIEQEIFNWEQDRWSR